MTKYFDLQDHEKLSYEVQRYRWLYEKAENGYIEEDSVAISQATFEIALNVSDECVYFFSV